jgi:RNA polymerase sigma-70 factor (ECF subfamily)
LNENGAHAMSGESIPETKATDMRLDVFEQHRGLLLSIAYRMLGSWADAEDMLQETFIRWQLSHEGEVREPRAFLVTVISRLCINHLQSARVRRETYFGEWLPEPLAGGSIEEHLFSSRPVEESLSMAFLVLLERLNPLERAVFLLREVFEYEYGEIAGIVGRNEANCRQILKRARQHVTELRPRFDASVEERETMLAAFVKATYGGDLEALIGLLSSNVVLHSDGGGKAPALPRPVFGPGNVARALLGGMNKLVPKNLVNRMASINGNPGVISYLAGRPFSVVTVEISEGRIRNVYIVTNPDKLARLDPLPVAPC